jgi:hypothetical protein
MTPVQDLNDLYFFAKVADFRLLHGGGESIGFADVEA